MAGFGKISAFFVGFVAVNYFVCQGVMSSDVTSDEAVESTSVVVDAGDYNITISPLPFRSLSIFQYDGESKRKNIDLILFKERYTQILERIVQHVPKDSTLLPFANVFKENIEVVTKDLPVEFALAITNHKPGKLGILIQRFLPLYMAERIANHKFPPRNKFFPTKEWKNLRGMTIKFVDDALKTPEMLCIKGKAQEAKKGDIGKTVEKKQT